MRMSSRTQGIATLLILSLSCCVEGQVEPTVAQETPTIAGELSASGEKIPLPGDEGFVTVKILYATNRTPLGLKGPLEGYSSQRGVGVAMGRVEATIPRTHLFGELEIAPVLILERRLRLPPIRSDPRRYITLREVVPEAPSAFASDAKEISEARTSLLLYIPDRVSFNTAAFRTAQLAYDLNFQGVTMFFSWPSTGANSKYLRDEQSAIASSVYLQSVFGELGNMPLDQVHIVADGMGCRVLFDALRGLSATVHSALAGAIRNVVFVFPDIDQQAFLERSPQIALGDARVTVYSAPNSRALLVSKQLHGFEPLGSLAEAATEDFDLVVVQPMDLLGHSYYAKSGGGLGDLSLLIRFQFGPAERNLKRVGEPPRMHWLLTQ